MRYQQVSVDVWKMTVTAASYLSLAFAAWVLLRLVSACISLPGYLRKQQEEEEEEERRLLMEMDMEQDQPEDGDEDEEDVGAEDSEDDKEAPVRQDGDAGDLEEGAVLEVPPTPKASRGRRRAAAKAEGKVANKVEAKAGRCPAEEPPPAPAVGEHVEKDEKKKRK